MSATSRASPRPPRTATPASRGTPPCAALTAWNAVAEVGRVKAGETVLDAPSARSRIENLRNARSSASREHIPNTRRIPFPPAWSPRAASIECIRDCSKGRGARPLNFGDYRQDVSSGAVGFCLDRRDSCALRRLDIGIAELDALRLCRRERRLCAPGDQCPLLFCERSVEVQDEWIDIRSKLSDEERYAMRHQTGNEVDVARETIELGDCDRAP